MQHARPATLVSYPAVLRRPPRLVGLLLELSRQRAAMVGLMIVAGLFVVAALAPWLAPYHYRTQNLEEANQPPSLYHWMGTDELGRDVYSRIIWGSRTSVFVLVTALAIGTPLGIVLGGLSGYFGGKVDGLIMRLADLMFAFPDILFVFFIAATLQPRIARLVSGIQLAGFDGRAFARAGYLDYLVVVVAIAFVGWAGLARLVRGQFLSLSRREFVEAARAMGASSWRIVFRHLLPNAMPPVVVALSMGAGGIILAEASLSFLGIGINPPNPSWGAMIIDNYGFYRTRPYLVWAPGIVLAMVIFAFNFLGDGLNEVLNPRTRRR